MKQGSNFKSDFVFPCMSLKFSYLQLPGVEFIYMMLLDPLFAMYTVVHSLPNGLAIDHCQCLVITCSDNVFFFPRLDSKPEALHDGESVGWSVTILYLNL